MAQLKDLIVNGPSRFIGDVYATTFTGDLNGNANTATSANTAAALTGKTLVTASAVTTSNWSTYGNNHIPTMSFMAYWNGAYSGTSSNLAYCAQGAIIGSNNIGNQSVKYATTSGSCNGNAATATKATQDGNGNVITNYYCTLNTKQILTGSKTFDAPNKIAFTADYDTILTSLSGKYFANSVLSWNTYHDHFAFLRDHTIVDKQKKISLNGNWEEDSTDLTSLFIQRECQFVGILTSSIKARRFSIYCKDNYHACNIEWLVLGLGYVTISSNFDLLIEYSADNSSWTTGFTGNIGGNQITYTLPLRELPPNQKYIRFTFVKTTNVDNGSVYLNMISALTQRKGIQGLGREYSFPYNWDSSFSIYPIKSDQKLGISEYRWKIYGASGNFSSSITASSFVRSGSTDDYILLGGGGHKLESSLSVNYATTAGSAPASDVYSWAKAETKPSYNGSEVALTTDYSNPKSYKAIEPGDSVQAAIAKLEGAISGLENLLASI